MRILYVITGLGLGGAEAITIDIANMMLSRGHQVAIMYLTGENQQKHRLGQGLEVVGLNMRKTPIGLIRALYHACKWIKAYSPNVVHSQMVHANLFCRFLRLFYRIPFLICTEHNKNIEGKIRMWLYRITDNLSDLNTNVSEEATSHFILNKAFGASKTITVYNGVDLAKYTKDEMERVALRKKYGIAANEFVLLNVGRLAKVKNQAFLIKAFSVLCRQGLAVKLVIVGKGEEEHNLRQLVTEYDLMDRCILAGAHSDVRPFYSAADCFVLTSLWEGFPMVLIEAMSMELPVITSECGREAVGDEKYVYSLEGRVQSLVEKMIQICHLSNEERAKIGKRNRLKALNFDLNKICDQWEKLYSQRN